MEMFDPIQEYFGGNQHIKKLITQKMNQECCGRLLRGKAFRICASVSAIRGTGWSSSNRRSIASLGLKIIFSGAIAGQDCNGVEE